MSSVAVARVCRGVRLPMPTAANRMGWDYCAKAAELGPPPLPAGDADGPATGIIDAHTHIHGGRASRIYDEARRLFGVTLTYTMTQLPRAAEVRDALGPSVRFMCIPTWSHPDRNRSHRDLYLRELEAFRRDFDARVMKLWGSPFLREFVPDGAADLQDIDAPWRREHCREAQRLGMMIMVHVADPDTWFAAKYADGGRFGTKAHHYVGLERMLDEHPVPWIAAHMGGWPEDPAFLDGLLSRHPNLHLDTSATKWIVRELSGGVPARPGATEAARALFLKHADRLLFGTDLVTLDDQLGTVKSGMSRMGDLSNSPEEAFELYCSRHWAQRALLETGYDGPSPIADPDLMMLDPARHDAMSAPALRGLGLPRGVLEKVYAGNARRVLGGWWARGG